MLGSRVESLGSVSLTDIAAKLTDGTRFAVAVWGHQARKRAATAAAEAEAEAGHAASSL